MTKRTRVRANSTEVARLAGVSIAAVSRAFAPGSSISPALAERVYAAARELNYVPNNLARSLITRRTNIVALMLPTTSNPIFAAMLDEISLRLEDQGKQVLLFTPSDVADFDRTLQHMLQYQVDAIVIAAASISSRMAALCVDRNVPVVTLGRYLPGIPVHSVRGDEHDAGTQAADLVLKGGGRRFGVIDGSPNLTTIVERKAAVTARLESAVGPGAIRIADGGLTYAGGHRAALALMEGPDRPDTLVCLTDIMALGAMDAVRHALGLRVPEDVAVVGFDDIPEAGYMSYQLSTVRTPVKEMAKYMIELISAKPEPAEPRAIKIPAQLIVRASTRGL
ncbi:MAG: LacI family transcriptional regulator [Caulobacter sp.]|nr:LacI family transcriptional regulator [Caulobacter sp.]